MTRNELRQRIDELFGISQPQDGNRLHWFWRRARWRWWDLRFGAARRVENATMWTARRLPKRLRYWVVVQAFGDAWEAAGLKTPDELTYTEVVNAVDPKHRGPGISRTVEAADKITVNMPDGYYTTPPEDRG